MRDANKTIRVDLSFMYFNTSSSKCLFDLFKTLKQLKKNGKDVEINWYYEEDDDDMMETGEDFADLLGLDFNFVEVREFNDVVLRQAV